MLITVIALLGALSGFLGIPSVCVVIFRAIRNPLMQQLADKEGARAAMEKDRDYFRALSESLKAELRERDRR